MMTRLIKISLFVIYFGTLAYGQEYINDSLIVDTSKNIGLKIEPYNVIWVQEVLEPNGNKRKGINTIWDNVDVTTNNNLKTIKRTIKWQDTSNNVYIKADVLNHKTLAPISVDIRWNPSYVQHTDFKENTAISISLKDKFSPSEISVSKVDNLSFIWSSDGFPLVAARFISKSKFHLKTITGLPHNISSQIKSFETIGSESLIIKGMGTIEAKVIKDISGGSINATYWLSEQRPYIVKVQFIQPNGQITTWQLKEFSW